VTRLSGRLSRHVYGSGDPDERTPVRFEIVLTTTFFPVTGLVPAIHVLTGGALVADESLDDFNTHAWARPGAQPAELF